MAILTTIREFYTYVHTKPNGDIFYVGKGCGKRSHNFIRRCQHHKNIIAKYGIENIGIFVFPCDSEREAFNDEVKQIAQLRKEGYNLINLTNGGEGPVGYKHTKEELKKISERSKGNTNRRGKKHTPEAKAQMSASKKGKFPSEETRKKLSAARLGKPGGMTGRKHKPETIEKMKAVRSNISSATREKLSISAKEQWANPEKRPRRNRLAQIGVK